MIKAFNPFAPFTLKEAIPFGKRVASLASLIKALFANNEKGVWYDPSDLSTMFQDSAGTTPVTAVGQPVGLLLDKSQGRVLGSELWVSPGLLSNATYSDGVWSLNSGFVYGNILTIGKSYLVTFTVDSYTSGSLSVRHPTLSSAIGSSVNTVGTYSRIITNASAVLIGFRSDPGIMTISNISVKELSGNHAYQVTSTARPVLRADPLTLGSELVTNGTFDSDTTGWTAVAETATWDAGRIKSDGTFYLDFPTEVGKSYVVQYDLGVSTSSGWVQIFEGGGFAVMHAQSAVSAVDLTAARLQFVATSATSRIYPRLSTGAFVWWDNISVKEVTAWDMEHAYLKFDGVDDFLVTSAIDFSATDKMSVFTGVHKASDAATGAIVELTLNPSVTNTGTFYVDAAGAAGANYEVYLRADGVRTYYRPITFTAPITNTLACLFDNSGVAHAVGNKPYVNNVLRQDGGAASSMTASNFSNAALYIGRRGGSSLPFNGHIYSLIVRGAATDATEQSNAEAYVNSKTGAY